MMSERPGHSRTDYPRPGAPTDVRHRFEPDASSTPQPLEIPKRMLGKTGVEVTILDAGTARAPGALDRLLRYEYSRGVRFFDTAASYGTEEGFKKWFAAMPQVRKEIFLATKDGSRGPA